MANIKLMVVGGVRPEWLKLISFINEARVSGFEVVIVNSGQHNELSKQVLDIFRIVTDYDLEIMKHNQTLNDIVINVMTKLTPIIKRETPDYMVVLGDTNTGVAAGLTAFYNKIPLIHLEGGARSYNRNDPYPEEINRKILDVIAEVNTCQTKQDQKYLAKENINNTLYVGNYSLDLFKILNKFGCLNNTSKEKRVLITMHRREGWGKPMIEACGAIKELANQHKDYTFIFPMHPNPTVQKNIKEHLKKIANVMLIDALPFDVFTTELGRCSFVMTDSGGIVQEALFLRKPVIYLRESSEYKNVCHPEMLIQTGKNKELIVKRVNKLLSGELPSHITTVFGDGNAGKRTVDWIVKNCKTGKKQ